MNSQQIFTRRKFAMDFNVWRTMLILCGLSILLLSYVTTKKVKCRPFNISIISRINSADSIYYTGSNIFFEANNNNLNQVTWTFGDKSGVNKKGNEVSYAFKAKGRFYVSASIEGECETGRWLTVETRPDSTVQPKISDKKILGVSSTIVGKAEEFMSLVMADSIFEWVVLSHPEMGIHYGENVKLQFANSGKYTIRLTLDNNRIKSFTKEVYVENDQSISKEKTQTGIPDLSDVTKLIHEGEGRQKESKTQDTSTVVTAKPESETTDKRNNSKKIFTGSEAFKSHLQELVENEMVEKEFYKYLCDSGSTLVVVNGKSKTFSALCSDIMGKTKKTGFVGLGSRKPIEISSVKLVRDDSKCVTKIEVKF